MSFQEKPIGDCCTLVNGRAFKPSDWTTDGLPIVRIQNLNDESKPLNRFSGEVRERFLIDTGDLLFSWSGTPGTSFGAFFWRRGKAILNQHIFRVEVDRSRVDAKYFRYALNSRLNGIIAQAHGGVGLKHITKGKLEATKVPLPPLAEQKRIASILDKADAIRRKRAQAMEITDQFLQSVFLDMFGDPVTNPKGWEEVTLEDVAEVITGFAFPSSDYATSQAAIRLCRGANVFPGRLDWSDLKTWPTERASEVSRFSLETGDVVLAMDRPWISTGLKIAQVSEVDLPSLLVQRVARIRGRNGISSSYLFTLLNQVHFERHCKPTETTVPHISPLELKSFAFGLPPKEVLARYDHRTTKLSRIRTLQGDALENCEQVFQSLVQRAFRGEL